MRRGRVTSLRRLRIRARLPRTGRGPVAPLVGVGRALTQGADRRIVHADAVKDVDDVAWDTRPGTLLGVRAAIGPPQGPRPPSSYVPLVRRPGLALVDAFPGPPCPPETTRRVRRDATRAANGLGEILVGGLPTVGVRLAMVTPGRGGHVRGRGRPRHAEPT